MAKIQITENPIQRQLRLLQTEYDEEKEAYRRLNDALGAERLKECGLMLHPLRPGRTYRNSLNQKIVEFTLPDTPDDEPDTELKNFEPGRPVMAIAVPSQPGAKTRTLFSGTVSHCDPPRIAVAVDDSADTSALERADGETGLASAFDETSYKAMFDALHRLAGAKGRLGELRDLFYSRRPAATYSFADISLPYLNASQVQGVNAVLKAKDVAILHGPPGTGKTTTLVEAIVETLRREPQVMVCAQSNTAVDWICEKLTERGVSVLRLGNPTRVNDRMLSSTYERRFADHPDYPELWAVRREINSLYRGARKGEGWRNRLDKLKARATNLEFAINEQLLADNKVVASTLVGSTHRLLAGRKFPTLFIDEAAQALEAASWIPIARAGRVVLAGDHCQLPPTVKSYEAMRQGLGTSLMERLVANHPECTVLLRTQYRMHEAIMQFSNQWFYGGGMDSAPEVRHRGILDWDVPMEWIDTAPLDGAGPEEGEPEDYGERHPGRHPGRVNPAEARLAVKVLEDYVDDIGEGRVVDERVDFGVISPYRAQTALLRRLIKGSRKLKGVRRMITVDTVDGFQGQERDVMLISLVRSNEKGEIGFLRDLRRMNVAMTRARMKVILVGNASTLGRHTFYRLLHDYISRL